MRNMTLDQEHRVLCPECGPVFMKAAEYYRQMSMPDSFWKCPNCYRTAAFDDIYEAQQMGDDVIPAVDPDFFNFKEIDPGTQDEQPDQVDPLCIYCKNYPCENMGHVENTEGCVEEMDLTDPNDDGELDESEGDTDSTDDVTPDLMPDFPWSDDHLHYGGEN